MVQLVLHLLPLVFLLQLSPLVSADFVQCLLSHSPSMSSIIFTHTNTSSYYTHLYQFAQNLRFKTPQTPQPLLILRPNSYPQIKSAIFCSKNSNLQMRIRSGGHDFEASSYVSDQPFFVLDMYTFRNISIDAATKTAWVGSGASLGEFYHAINKTDPGLAFPGGYWLTVCIGGHISGGGFGPLVRKHGVAADHVIDAVVMNADGRILNRETMGEDLFWAIRGGVGSSFCVILSYKLEIVDNPARVSAFKVVKTVDKDATSVFYRYEHIAHRLPVDITFAVGIKNVFLPENGAQTIQITFVALYLGDADGLYDMITKEFAELGLRRDDCVELGYLEYFLYHFGFPIEKTDEYMLSRSPPRPDTYFKAKSDFVQDPIPVDGLEKLWGLMTKVPPGKAQMRWIPFGGRNDEISPSSIPFPHRAGNSFVVWENIEWNVTELDVAEERIDWIRNFYEVMGGYVAGNPRRAYGDYTDNDLGVNDMYGTTTSVEQARKWGQHYFLDNFDRLVRVKTKVDPGNFFRREQSIPPSFSATY